MMEGCGYFIIQTTRHSVPPLQNKSYFFKYPNKPCSSSSGPAAKYSLSGTIETNASPHNPSIEICLLSVFLSCPLYCPSIEKTFILPSPKLPTRILFPPSNCGVV